MPSTSIFMKSMEAVQTAIQGLGLTGLSSSNVLIHKVPRDLDKDMPATSPLPAIIISPRDAEGADPRAGTNLKDDVVYPIQIVILDQDGQNQTTNFDRYLQWRETIRRTFHNKRLSGVSEVTGVVVQPKTIVDPERWIKGQFVSALVLAVTSREARL